MTHWYQQPQYFTQIQLSLQKWSSVMNSTACDELLEYLNVTGWCTYPQGSFLRRTSLFKEDHYSPFYSWKTEAEGYKETIFVVGRGKVCLPSPILKCKGWDAACPESYQVSSAPACPPARELPWGESGSPRAAGDYPKCPNNPVAAQGSRILDVKQNHGIFLSNCKHQD